MNMLFDRDLDHTGAREEAKIAEVTTDFLSRQVAAAISLDQLQTEAMNMRTEDLVGLAMETHKKKYPDDKAAQTISIFDSMRDISNNPEMSAEYYHKKYYLPELLEQVDYDDIKTIITDTTRRIVLMGESERSDISRNLGIAIVQMLAKKLPKQN